MRITMDLDPWYEIADGGGSYDERMAAFRALADEELDDERYHAFVGEHLSHLDEVMFDYVDSADFDELIVLTSAPLIVLIRGSRTRNDLRLVPVLLRHRLESYAFVDGRSSG